MAKIKVLQKAGSSRLDKQVSEAIVNGWAVYGSPFILNGLPTQVVVHTGVKSVDARYKAVQKDGLLSMESQVETMMDEGWRMYMEPLEFGGQPVQVMVYGDIQVMPLETVGGSAPAPVLPNWRIEVINKVSTYTIQPRDHLKQLVFEGGGDVVVKLPLFNDDLSSPFRCALTNASGLLTLDSDGIALVSPSKVFAKGGTGMMMAAKAMWLATGDFDLNYWGQ